MNRSSGILLPLFSLPSPYGIGCMDKEAYRFVDFLSQGGQSYWQLLPLYPTGYGDSPYQAYSAFAGSPLYIDLEDFISRGWLTREECDEATLQTSPHRVDYGHQYRRRLPLLRRAFARSGDHEWERLPQKKPQLWDYALFMALKEAHGGAPWQTWPRALRRRDPEALEKAQSTYGETVAFYLFLQHHFDRQWQSLRAYAKEKKVRIIGDMPIYVACDSADVWVSQKLFDLDEDGYPSCVAGCPPDGFSPNGQVWGNPLYHWPAHAADGYGWWISRLNHAFDMYDAVRIDHFRGFDAYFSIPHGHTTAVEGHWEQGPGMALFDAVTRALGHREIIAEDLGFMTDSVRRLLKDSGFPGMRILQFAFDARDTGGEGEHLPHRYPHHCVAYTGTHDNQTLAAWLKTIPPETLELVRGYLGDWFTPPHLLFRSLISLLLRSPADLCIIPMQDWLSLDDTARINTPATTENNWQWRMGAGSASPSLAREIRCITKTYGR